VVLPDSVEEICFASLRTAPSTRLPIPPNDNGAAGIPPQFANFRDAGYAIKNYLELLRNGGFRPGGPAVRLPGQSSKDSSLFVVKFEEPLAYPSTNLRTIPLGQSSIHRERTWRKYCFAFCFA